MENLENNFGDFQLNTDKNLEELLVIGVQNNSMLRVMLSNQAKIMSILDPSKSHEQYSKEFLEDFKDYNLHKFTTIVGRSSN